MAYNDERMEALLKKLFPNAAEVICSMFPNIEAGHIIITFRVSGRYRKVVFRHHSGHWQYDSAEIGIKPSTPINVEIKDLKKIAYKIIRHKIESKIDKANKTIINAKEELKYFGL